jgi:hypothetical protein
MKEIIAVISVLIIVFLYYKDKINAFYFVVMTIPFPIYIQFMGRDSFTITTLLVLALFFIDLLLNSSIKKTIPPGIKVLLFLIYGGTILSSLQVYRIEHLRYLLGFASGLIIFHLAIKLITDKHKFDVVIKILALGIALNIVVAILQAINIRFAFYDIFAPSHAKVLEYMDKGLLFFRPSGFINDYELFSEWLILLFPWIFMLYQETKNKWLLLLLIIFPIGLVITVTRSSIILFIISLLFLVYFIKGHNNKHMIRFVFVLFIVLAFSFLLIIFLFPRYILIFYDRIMAINIRDMGEFGSMINRGDRWNAFYSHDLRLFGYGELSDQSGSFHSLYFTIMYKDGLIGIILFGLFIFQLIKNAYQTIEIYNYRLISLLIIAMFLINEIKIEYLRYSFTIQYSWLIFAFPFVLSKFIVPEENN